MRRLLVLPLYPQYSATTTGSVFDAVVAELRDWRSVPHLRLIADYFAEPAYIAALAQRIEAHRAQHGPADRLLFSFHGIPDRYFRNGDPYFCHCQATARLVAERLALPADAWAVSFQSRVGREKWLQPYTDELLSRWARDGVRSVQAICPGFAVDCLETLGEIAIENRERFLHAGGERFEYIAALNDGDDHASLLCALLLKHVQGWPPLAAGREADTTVAALDARARRSQAMKGEV